MSTKPSRILVTGGTGYLGAHIVDLLLDRGIVVVVTARSESKANNFVERRSRFKELLEVVVTGDLTAVGAFDDLAKDVDVIIHCASPLPNEASSGSTPSKSIIEPAITGTLSILQAARKTPTLKRLVLTSSFSAVLNGSSEGRSETHGEHYTAQDWNPGRYEETDDPLVAYRIGKKYAELEAWAAVDPTSGQLRQLELDPNYPRPSNSTKPRSTAPPNDSTFDLTVFCPPLIFGPWVHPLSQSGLISLNDSICQFRNIVRGDYRASHLPNAPQPLWVDVRDVAFAHVEAALRLDSSEHPSISNGRYAICSPEKFNYHIVGEIMREEFPEWAEEVLPPRDETPQFRNMSLDGTPVTRDLGVTYRSFRQCVTDLVRQLRLEVLRETEANKS